MYGSTKWGFSASVYFDTEVFWFISFFFSFSGPMAPHLFRFKPRMVQPPALLAFYEESWSVQRYLVDPLWRLFTSYSHYSVGGFHELTFSSCSSRFVPGRQNVVFLKLYNNSKRCCIEPFLKALSFVRHNWTLEEWRTQGNVHEASRPLIWGLFI